MPLHVDNRAAALTSPRSYTTTLLAVFADEYGTEFLDWDPDTYVLAAKADFNVVLPQTSLDRLMVGRLLHTTDVFETQVRSFIHFCNVLSGETYDPRMFNPATVADMAWGITEAFMLDPPSAETLKKGEMFSSDIIGYIGAKLADEGFLSPPDIIRMVVVDDSALRRVQERYKGRESAIAEIDRFDKIRLAAVNTAVLSGLVALLRQLELLSLKTGDAAEVASGMLKTLEAA